VNRTSPEQQLNRERLGWFDSGRIHPCHADAGLGVDARDLCLRARQDAGVDPGLIERDDSDRRLVRGVDASREMRFFGGLSVEETADVLHVSNDTIKRDWRLAKMWLLRELEGGRA